MSATQVILLILLSVLVFLGVYVGFRFVSYKLDEKFPQPVQIQPVSHVDSAGTPPESWWDALQALQARYTALQTEVKGYLADSENNLRLARSAEERARKLRRDKGYAEVEDEEYSADDERPAALLPPVAEGWETAATAPAAPPSASRLSPAMQTRLNSRRGR